MNSLVSLARHANIRKRLLKNRETRLFIYFIAMCLLLFLLFSIALVLDYHCGDWVKFHVYHRNYLKWKEKGGMITDASFYDLIMADPNRDDMVKGLSYEQIFKKFPFLVAGELYPPKSYKGEFLIHKKEDNPETKMLWFCNKDGWDWVIILNHNGTEILLVKG